MLTPPRRSLPGIAAQLDPEDPRRAGLSRTNAQPAFCPREGRRPSARTTTRFRDQLSGSIPGGHLQRGGWALPRSRLDTPGGGGGTTGFVLPPGADPRRLLRGRLGDCGTVRTTAIAARHEAMCGWHLKGWVALEKQVDVPF